MTQKISPISVRPFLDANGDPYSGAQLFAYTAGSTTKDTLTQDLAGAVSHANPIVLNSKGEIANGAGAAKLAWQSEGVKLDFVLAPSDDSDPPLSAIDTWEDVEGINDTSVSLSEWINGPAPTFISAVTFSLVGDQTSTFHVGRRVKTTNTSGDIYSVITATAYTSLTTVTVVNDSGVLDSGLSAVSYGLLSSSNSSSPGDLQKVRKLTLSGIQSLAEGANIASATDCDIWAGGDGNTVHLTGTTPVTDWGTAPQAGASMRVIFDAATPLTFNSTTNDITGGVSYTTEAGDIAIVYARTTGSFKVTIFPYDGSPFGAPTAAQGSSRVLINTLTASASATVDFTSGIDSTYDRYIIEITGMIAATVGSTLFYRISEAGVFKTGSLYYYTESVNVQGGTAADAGGAGATSMRIGNSVETTAPAAGLDATMWFSDPANTVNSKRFYGLGVYHKQTVGLAGVTFSGYYSSTAAVDGIRFYMDSGNINSGVFRLYGIKDA